mgnify:CR=1 FL=1
MLQGEVECGNPKRPAHLPRFALPCSVASKIDIMALIDDEPEGIAMIQKDARLTGVGETLSGCVLSNSLGNTVDGS